MGTNQNESELLFTADDGNSRTQQKSVAPFALFAGEFSFRPDLFPETIRVRKKRNLDRSQNFCAGEDVTDNGSENREIHITGRVRGSEKDVFDAILDWSDTLILTSATWSGEVHIAEGEYEGPAGYYPPTGEMYWQYTVDLVSTGPGEPEGLGTGTGGGGGGVAFNDL
jgi:hypothetical protein